MQHGLDLVANQRNAPGDSLPPPAPEMVDSQDGQSQISLPSTLPWLGFNNMHKIKCVHCTKHTHTQALIFVQSAEHPESFQL